MTLGSSTAAEESLEPVQFQNDTDSEDDTCHHRAKVKTDDNTCGRCKKKWSAKAKLAWSQCDICKLWYHDKCYWLE